MTEHTDYEALRGNIRGEVLRPDDAGYDEARALWNGMIDRRPAAIVRCRGTADVMAAVRFARDQGMPVSVKAGGHNVAGRSLLDDGIVVDVAPMNSVRVDPEAKTVSVGPGARWRDVDAETQAFGLATTGGVHSGTGVAGLTLGGGVGWLARRFGLAADNLRSADVVLADGERVVASAEQNPELFWALRGGGGSFGVVTSFAFDLHEVGPEVMTAQAYHSLEDGAEALRFYRDFTANASDALACYAMILKVPPVHPFPEAYHGQVTVALVAVHSGERATAEAELEPLQSFGSPILAAVQPAPYAAFQKAFDAGTPDGGRYYYKSHFVDELADGLIERVLHAVDPLPGAYTIVGIEPLGGAIDRVDADATAYPHRGAAFNVSAWAGWIEPADDASMTTWARAFYDATAAFGTGGTYVNYLDTDDQDKVQDAFGANRVRLQKVKATYDPDDLFRTQPYLVPRA